MFADINGYTDTKDVWAEVNDTNLANSKEQNGTSYLIIILVSIINLY